MELTGKCKQAFEEWLIQWLKINICLKNEVPNTEDVEAFYKYPNSMQWGVYQDFFDNVEIYICMVGVFLIKSYGYSYSINCKNNHDIFKTRPEVRTEAIKQANIIYNNR